jgi:hypothetical protein
MTLLLSEVINRISYALRGTDESAPASSSAEWTYWLSIANRKKDELHADVGKQWSCIYKATQPNEPGTVATTGTTALTGTNTYFQDYRVGDKITVDGETVRTIATITSDTALTVTVAFSNTASSKTFTRTTIIATSVLTYNVHRNLLGLSDRPYVLDTNDNKIYLDLIHPQERDYVSQQVHMSGMNPEVLTFTEDIESTDQMVGGSLILPGYYMPADMTANTDEVPVPDPNWLALAVAAEVAFTDIVYEDRAVTLNNKANALWKAMVAQNNRGTYGQPRTTAYNVKSRVRDTRVR